MNRMHYRPQLLLALLALACASLAPGRDAPGPRAERQLPFVARGGDEPHDRQPDERRAEGTDERSQIPRGHEVGPTTLD